MIDNSSPRSLRRFHLFLHWLVALYITPTPLNLTITAVGYYGFLYNQIRPFFVKLSQIKWITWVIWRSMPIPYYRDVALAFAPDSWSGLFTLRTSWDMVNSDATLPLLDFETRYCTRMYDIIDDDPWHNWTWYMMWHMCAHRHRRIGRQRFWASVD